MTTGRQLLKITPNDGSEYDYFGADVAISGDLAIVGAPGRFRFDKQPRVGAAYLFDATTGRQLGKFTADDGWPYDHFGSSVDIDGERAVIVSPHVQDTEDSGATFIFDVTLPKLKTGDANQDLSFDQVDIIQVLQAAKYLTGQTATWGGGDWNGGPGGYPGQPPVGDGLFNQSDIVAALQVGAYLAGPYAAIGVDGVAGDDQTSVVYDANAGELKVDAPNVKTLFAIDIYTAGSKFIRDKPSILDGGMDFFSEDNIFRLASGAGFGSITFGNVLPSRLSVPEVAADLSVTGMLSGGGDLGDVDLVFVPVPEPGAIVPMLFGLLTVLGCRRGIASRELPIRALCC